MFDGVWIWEPEREAPQIWEQTSHNLTLDSCHLSPVLAPHPLPPSKAHPRLMSSFHNTLSDTLSPLQEGKYVWRPASKNL
jgi:hypothetical protein